MTETPAETAGAPSNNRQQNKMLQGKTRPRKKTSRSKEKSAEPKTEIKTKSVVLSMRKVPSEFKLNGHQRKQFEAVLELKPDWNDKEILEFCQKCKFNSVTIQQGIINLFEDSRIEHEQSFVEWNVIERKDKKKKSQTTVQSTPNEDRPQRKPQRQSDGPSRPRRRNKDTKKPEHTAQSGVQQDWGASTSSPAQDWGASTSSPAQDWGSSTPPTSTAKDNLVKNKGLTYANLLKMSIAKEKPVETVEEPVIETITPVEPEIPQVEPEEHVTPVEAPTPTPIELPKPIGSSLSGWGASEPEITEPEPKPVVVKKVHQVIIPDHLKVDSRRAKTSLDIQFGNFGISSPKTPETQPEPTQPIPSPQMPMPMQGYPYQVPMDSEKYYAQAMPTHYGQPAMPKPHPRTEEDPRTRKPRMTKPHHEEHQQQQPHPYMQYPMSYHPNSMYGHPAYYPYGAPQYPMPYPPAARYPQAYPHGSFMYPGGPQDRPDEKAKHAGFSDWQQEPSHVMMEHRGMPGQTEHAPYDSAMLSHMGAPVDRRGDTPMSYYHGLQFSQPTSNLKQQGPGSANENSFEHFQSSWRSQ